MVHILIAVFALKITLVAATLADMNNVMLQKERNVDILVNETQRIFAARCATANMCVYNKTVCSQPSCGSSFMATPGLRCDKTFGVNKKLCGKHCSGLLRSIQSSTVQVAPGLEDNQEAATFICSSAELTPIFKDLYINQGVTGWQYVASNTGVTRTYPAAAQTADKCNISDVRQEAWYVSASTGPKDIVFLCDYSDSMNAQDGGPNGMTRLMALKNIMKVLLNSLTPVDRFRVVTFGGAPKVLGAAPEGLLVANSTNIAEILSLTLAARTTGGTVYGTGFTKAFSMFTADASTSTNCTRVLMFLTDGQPTDGTNYKNAISDGQASLGDRRAMIMTYSLSTQADELLLQKIACSWNGTWAPVHDGSQPNNPAKQYYNWIAMGIQRPKPRWTSPYNSSFGQGVIVTVSKPIFDYSVTPKVFVGVAAIDVLLSELLVFGTYTELLRLIAARSDYCLDYDLSPCQRQLLRSNQSFECTSPEPQLSSCASTTVKAPSCNTTIITNINQVFCSPYKPNGGFNSSQQQCCEPQDCSSRSKSVSFLTRTLPSTRTPTLKSSKTNTVTRSSASLSCSQAVSFTLTLSSSNDPSVSGSVEVTQTEAVTLTVANSLTTSLGSSNTPDESISLQLSPTDVLTTATISATVTATLTVSRTKKCSPSNSAWLSLTAHPSVSKSWECVGLAYAAAVLNFSSTDVDMWAADITRGVSLDLVLPALPDVERQPLHIQWFRPFNISLRATLLSRPPYNDNGFLSFPGYTGGIILEFPNGITSSTLNRTVNVTSVRLVIPPQDSFNIFSAEVVALDANISSFTIGVPCGNETLSKNFFVLYISTESSMFLGAAHNLISTTVVSTMAISSVLGGAAAADLQVLVMTAMIPCANTFQRRSFELYRAISPFAISDSFEGVLWGNLVANVAFLALHIGLTLLVTVVRKTTFSEATLVTRFPNFTLQVLLMTYPGTAFASLQLFLNSSNSSQLFLAIGTTLIIVIGYPAGVLTFIVRNVEAFYDRYEFHRWRRGASSARVRLLSRVMLPIGCWEPPELRRRFGTIITLQCRPEYVWITFPVWSPLIISLLGLVDINDPNKCIWVYAAMLLLHIVLIAVVAHYKPFRSMIEDWLAALALTLTSLLLGLTVGTLKVSSSTVLHTAIWVVGILQVVLMIVRLIYHVAHIFIARGLREHVPHKEAFRWHMGSVERDAEVLQRDVSMDCTALTDLENLLLTELDDINETLLEDEAPVVTLCQSSGEEHPLPTYDPTSNEFFLRQLYADLKEETVIDELIKP